MKKTLFFNRPSPIHQDRFLKTKFFAASLYFLLFFVSVLTFPGSIPFAQETVDPKTGRLSATQTDLVFQSGAVNLEVTRTLNQNRDQSPGYLGKNWRLNWERRLVRLDSICLISDSNGPFTYNQTGKANQYQSFMGEQLFFQKDGSAILSKLNGVKETFDSAGHLAQISLLNGNQINILYGLRNQVERIEGPKGQFLKFFYEEKGKLIRIVSSGEDSVTYSYNQNRLEKVTINGINTFYYEYGSNGELVKSENIREGSFLYAYDSVDRVISRTFSDGIKERFEYDEATRTYKYISPSGSITTTTWSKDDRKQEIVDSGGNKNIVEYDQNGRILKIIGPAGMISGFEYDKLGRTTAIYGCCNDAVQLEYLSDSQLIKTLKNLDGTHQTFEYDANNNLIKIQNSDGSTTRFSYYPDGLLKSVEKNFFLEKQLTYHPNGQIKSVTNGMGERFHFEYDSRGNLIRETDPSGKMRKWAYDNHNRLVSSVDAKGAETLYEYGDANRIIKETGPGKGVTRYDYDSRGRVITETDPEGYKTSFHYNLDGQLNSVTDHAGNSYKYVYDQPGRLIHEINPLGGTSSYVYDQAGNIISSSDPTGKTVRFSYTEKGILLKSTVPSGELSYEYDLKGRLSSFTDPSGYKTAFQRDESGRVIREFFPNGLVKTFEYDSTGSVIAESDNQGKKSRFSYDRMGRIIKEEKGSGFSIRYQYDWMGNVIKREDNTGETVSMEYDETGNLVRTIGPAGTLNRFRYDLSGRLIETIDSLNRVKRMSYNARGELSQVAQGNGDRATYIRDHMGRITQIQHPGGGKTEHSYDALGNPISSKDPLERTFSRKYDNVGRLISQTDAKGQTITFSYDSSGRIASKRFNDGKDIHYRYDKSNHLIEIDDGLFPLRYEYDENSRLSQIEYPAIKRKLKYRYASNGQLSEFIDSEGRPIHYQYDEIGRLKTITLSKEISIEFGYDTKNRLIFVRNSNGITAIRRYDAVGSIISIHYTDREGKTLFEGKYRYDIAGQLQETKTSEGEHIYYVYDDAGQLIEETRGSNTIKYGYHPGGNRSRKNLGNNTLSYEYNLADQVTQTGKESFKYDANGNLIERQSPNGSTRYKYDAENHLIGVTKPDGKEVLFGYSPLGERIWRKDESGTTWFVSDGINRIADLDDTLTPKAAYLFAPGIDRPLAMHIDQGLYFFCSRELGSIAFLTGLNGEIVTSYQTDAFGNLLKTSGNIPNPFIYTAREYEKDLGLYYYRARYYDPGLGRFITPDPIAPSPDTPLSLNRYIYAQNAPTLFTDPLGTSPNLLDAIPDPFADPEREAARLAASRRSEETWQLLREVDSRRTFKPEQVDYSFYERNMGIKKDAIDNAIRLRQNLLGESRPLAEHEVYHSLQEAELRIDRTPKGMMNHVINRAESDAIDFGKIPKPGASGTPAPPSGSHVSHPMGPHGQTIRVDGRGGPTGSPTVKAPQPGPSSGSGLRGALQRFGGEIKGGVQNLGQKIKGGWNRFVHGEPGALGRFVEQHPNAVHLTLGAAQLASCQARNLTTADCITEFVISQGVSRAIVAVAGVKVAVAIGAAGTIIYAGTEAYQQITDALQRREEEKKRQAEAEKNRLKVQEMTNKLRMKVTGQLSSIKKLLDSACKALAGAATTAKQHADEAMRIAQQVQQDFEKSNATLACCESVGAIENEILAIQGRIQQSGNRMKASLEKARALAQACKSEKDADKARAEFNLAKSLYQYVDGQYQTAQANAISVEKCKKDAIALKSSLSSLPAVKKQVYDEAEKALKHFENFQDTFVAPAEGFNKTLEGMCDGLLREIDALRGAMGIDPLLPSNEAEFSKLKAEVERFRGQRCNTSEHHGIHNQATGNAYTARGHANKLERAAELISKLAFCAQPGVKGLAELKAARSDAVVAMHNSLDISGEINACIFTSILASLDDDDQSDIDKLRDASKGTDTNKDDTGTGGSQQDTGTTVPDDDDWKPTGGDDTKDERRDRADADDARRQVKDEGQGQEGEYQADRTQDQHDKAETMAQVDREQRDQLVGAPIKGITSGTAQGVDTLGTRIGRGGGTKIAQNIKGDKNKPPDQTHCHSDSDCPTNHICKNEKCVPKDKDDDETEITVDESASSANAGGQSGAPQDTVINIADKIPKGAKVIGVSAQLNGQAFNIPDTFQIIYDGKVIASGGGKGGISISGAAKGSSPQITMRVIAPLDETKWEWSGKATFSIKKKEKKKKKK
jgi:RHS repeat-associated protein